MYTAECSMTRVMWHFHVGDIIYDIDSIDYVDT